MTSKFNVGVTSETGRLTGVVVHRPGREVANMTPGDAERALYSDILNLSVAAGEYDQLLGVLEKRTRTFHIGTLLAEVLENSRVRGRLLQRICEAEETPESLADLEPLPAADVARLLVEGVPLRKDNLSRFLSPDRYALPPLHNFFFTRDSAVVMGERALIACMANRVRGRETRIVEAIFDFHPAFSTATLNPARHDTWTPSVTIEGGDVLVAGPEVLVVGMGARTSRQAIDFLIEDYRRSGRRQHIVVQELPTHPESFIHLDMVFTLLDRDACLVFAPVIMQTHHYDVVHIHIEGGKVVAIREEDTLLTALAHLGIDLEPLFCGGRKDSWVQEREQWHSGANVFALAPGQVVGYGRNDHTVEELAAHGFAVVPAADVISGASDLEQIGRCVVTISGSELARGGGGCRCMTMPVGREPLDG
jgi:arginine deiminase